MAGDRLGRGPRPGGRRPGRGHQRARPQRRRRLPRQPQRALPRLGHPRPGHGEDAAHPQPVQRLVGRPDPAPAGRLAALRPPAPAADPRHRPHVVLPGVRRQPDGLQRLADDRARLPEPAARAQGARRPDGRRRPAPHRDRQGRRRAPLRPPRLGRRGRAGHGAHAVRGGPDPPGAVRRPGRPRARARRALHPRGGRAGQRHRGRRRTPPGPGAGRGRQRGGGAAYGRIGVSTTGFGSLAQWGIQCLNILTGHFDQPGGVLFTEPADRLRGAAVRRHRPLRPVAQPGARHPGVRRRAPGRGDARGDRDARATARSRRC